jgi:hypothetical protein
VSGTQTTLTILLTSFPIILGEALFGVQAPMAIVLLGPAIGGAYVALNLFSAFLQSFAVWNEPGSDKLYFQRWIKDPDDHRSFLLF